MVQLVSCLTQLNKGALTELLFITITVDALTKRILMSLAKHEENQYIKRLQCITCTFRKHMLSTGTKPREMAIDLFHFLSSSCRSTILPLSTPDNLQNKYNISFITNKKYIVTLPY